METNIFIDYLQYSIDWKKLPIGNKKIPPLRNYKTAFQNIDGGRVYLGNALTPEKALVIYSGNALAMMRKDGMPTLDFINSLIDQNAKISRLDMTIDFYVGEDFLSVDDFVEFWQNDLIISTHAKHEPKFYGSVTSFEKNIETLNFVEPEKRAKKGMVRVYDTGLEQGIMRDIITRIEVEEKRDKAHTSAIRCIEHGIAETLKSRFDVVHPTWLAGIGTATAPTHRGLQKETDKDIMDSRWRWLFDQVAPSLKDAIVHDMAYERYDRILEFFDIIDPEHEITGL